MDIVNARAGRTAANSQLEALDGVGVPFSDDFDAAIVLVANVAAHVLAPCRIFNEQAKPNPLHPALYDETTRHEHEKLYLQHW